MTVAQRAFDQADRMPLTRSSIEALAEEHFPEDLALALDEALRRGAPAAAERLAFAIMASGERLDVDHVLALLPEISSIEQFGPLVGAARGDRVDVLVRFLDADTGSWEREALALLLAAEELARSGQAVPRALLRHARRLARRPLDATAGILLGAAAARLGDAYLSELAGAYVALAERSQAVVADVLERVQKSVLATLPQKETRFVSGYTVRREAPAVGRNDPCPCGSGKKFKKCCALKTEPLNADSPPAGSAPVPTVDPRMLSHHQVDQMRPSELARLETSALSTRNLIGAMRRLCTHRRWSAAERCMEELAGRTDLPGGESDAEGWRLELVEDAVRARALEVAERQLAKLSPDLAADRRLSLRLACLRRDPDLLPRIEEAARAALEDESADGSGLIELAFALLERLPALGIPLARAALREGRFFDNESLLRAAEEARDELLLPPLEPWWDVLDAAFAPASRGSRARESAESAELLAELRAAQAQTRAASEELDRAKRRMEELDRETKTAAVVPAATPTAPVPEPHRADGERRRLGSKLEDLRRIVREGQDERRALRHRLAELEEAANGKQGKRRRAGPFAQALPAEPDEDLEGTELYAAEPLAAPRSVLIPELGPHAAKALTELEASTAGLVLSLIADLAAGRENAWRDAKRLERARAFSSARAGLHYRVLFSAQDRTLRVEHIVHRRDLEKTVARL